MIMGLGDDTDTTTLSFPYLPSSSGLPIVSAVVQTTQGWDWHEWAMLGLVTYILWGKADNWLAVDPLAKTKRRIKRVKESRKDYEEARKEAGFFGRFA